MVKDILDMAPLLFERGQAPLYGPDIDGPAVITLLYRLLQDAQQQNDECDGLLIFEGQMGSGESFRRRVPRLLSASLNSSRNEELPNRVRV